MNTFKTRLFYSGVLVLALSLGYTLSSAMIQENREKNGLGQNEYYRKIECMKQEDSPVNNTCQRILA